MRKRTRWWFLGALGVAALAIAVVAATPTGRSRARSAWWEVEYLARTYLTEDGRLKLALGRASDALDVGEYEKADRLLAKVHARRPEWPYAAFLRAKVLARLGRGQEALDALEVSVDEGFRDLYSIQDVPAFDTLRDDARFASLLEFVRGESQELQAALHEASRPIPFEEARARSFRQDL